MGKLVRRTVLKHARLNRDHGRTGRAVELPVQASFHNLAVEILKEFSHESCVFTFRF